MELDAHLKSQPSTQSSHSRTDLARKQDILKQFKAAFDAQPTESGTAYTAALAPALLGVLREGPGDDADADHAVRKSSLELLARIKLDEQLKPFAIEVLRTCMHVRGLPWSACCGGA